MAKITVNAMGEQCPIPVVKAKKALDAMVEPGVLEVLVDNEIAVQNLLRLASGSGLQAKSEKLADKQFTVTMEAGAGTAPEKTPEIACTPDRRKNLVVAIGSASMGVGSEELGKTLMKGFLYALSQQEELPRTILFFNGGATIPIQGSVSVEDLKSMEAQGVQILTCGTCLDYYGLKDRLAVGGVTNMYDIVEKQMAADLIVKP